MSGQARKTRRNRTNRSRNLFLSHRLPPGVWVRKESPSKPGVSANYRWDWRTDIGRDLQDTTDALLTDEGSVIGVVSGAVEVGDFGKRCRYSKREAPQTRGKRNGIRARHGSEAFPVVWVASKAAKNGGYWRKASKKSAA